MTETSTATTWLTQEAFDRLTAELEELSGPRRAEIVERIALAREEGDLKENGGYHAAKDEQGKVEARIKDLTELLRKAQVGAAPDTGGKAGPGMVVEVRFDGDTDVERFLIGSREDSGHGIEVYSAQSPLGAAITGAAAGDAVGYVAPNGKQMHLTVVSVQPYTG